VSILSDFEDRISRAVEGGFARVFRSPVQPAELAHKLGREMDRRRVVGVGKVFAPTLYSVLLSPEDDEKLGGFADTLAGELETYLVGYARERNYALATRPIVRFLVDDELRLGRFDVIGELLSPEEIADELGENVADVQLPAASGGVTPTPVAGPMAGAPSAVLTSTPTAEPPFIREPRAAASADAPMPSGPQVFDAEAETGEPADTAAAEAHEPSVPATVTVRGVDHDVVLRGDRMVVGRLSACDICLGDVNASRQHAAFVREGADWAIEDLGSTNGTLVNGHAVEFQPLRDDDVVVVGITELVYHQPKRG